MDKETYFKTEESQSPLFERRIKLAELSMVTITALIAMIALSNLDLKRLIYSVLALSVNLIFLIKNIMVGSNKVMKITDFSNIDNINKKEISYEMEWADIACFSVYGLSILWMIIVFCEVIF